MTKNDLEFVLFVISENSPIHSAIKFVCDVKLGVSSKCIKTRTIDKVLSANKSGDKKSAPDACIVNLLYGLNPKFDGENVIGVNAEFAQNLLSSCPTLIIGKLLLDKLRIQTLCTEAKSEGFVAVLELATPDANF